MIFHPENMISRPNITFLAKHHQFSETFLKPPVKLVQPHRARPIQSDRSGFNFGSVARFLRIRDVDKQQIEKVWAPTETFKVLYKSQAGKSERTEESVERWK